MKTTLKDFLNENKKENILPLPKRDEKYDFLIDIVSKCRYEDTMLLPSKEPVEIGTCGNHKMYFNYVDKSVNENSLGFWFIYNEQQDDLYGTKWEFGVLYEENGHLMSTDKHDEITLLPNFVELIYNEFKSYNDLDKWCKTIKEHGIESRASHRWAIQNSKNNKTRSWEDSIKNIENNIFHEKYFNRHSKPFDQRQLDEMNHLGEVEWNKLNDKRQTEIKSIIDDMIDNNEI